MKKYSHEHSLGRLSRAMNIPRSNFYAHQKLSERARANQELSVEIERAYQEHKGRYGSPRMRLHLQKEGYSCGENRVARFMKAAGLAGITPRRKRPRTTDSRHGGPIVANLIKNLELTGPNQVRAADITYIRTQSGWVYLAAVLDVYSRKTVGWQMAETMRAELVIEALQRTLSQQKWEPGLILHSDRGSQYASEAYRNVLVIKELKQSMSAKGNCYENATMESFLGTLKREDLDHVEFSGPEEARSQVFAYIETYYNRDRIHTSLGGASPLDYEQQWKEENKDAPKAQRFLEASDAHI